MPAEDDEFIKIPEQPAATFSVFGTDRPMTMEEMLALVPEPQPDARPDVAIDRLPQPPALTDQTMEEINAGRNAIQPMVVVPGVPDAVAIATMRHQQAREAEQAAGRAVVARKQAELARGKEIMAMAAAHRLKAGAAPSTDDLEYNPTQK